MKLHVLLSIVIVCMLAETYRAEAGIIRRSRRIHRYQPTHYDGRLARSGSAFWRERLEERKRGRVPHFLAPPRTRRMWARNSRRYRFSPADREDRYGHSQRLRLPLMMRSKNRERERDPMHASGSNPTGSWRPLDYGNPIERDPLFDYAPPSVERVRFDKKRPSGGDRRHKPGHGKPPRIMNKQASPKGKQRPPLFDRPRRPPTGPALWKLLANKQRPRPYQQRLRRPPYMRFPENNNRFNEEAEVSPNINGLVYFKPQDVISSSGNVRQTIIPGYKPGTIKDAPLYSSEVTSPSQFNPVPATTSTTPHSLWNPPSPIDILYTPNKYMNPTTGAPTILEPVRSTTYSYHPTPAQVYTPREPERELDGDDNEESLLEIIQNPPKPLNSFSVYNHLNSVVGGGDEGQESNVAENVIIPSERPRPVFVETSFQEFKPSPLITTTPSKEEEEEEVNKEATAVSVSTSVSSSTSFQVRVPEKPVARTTTTTTTTTAAPSTTTTEETAGWVEEITKARPAPPTTSTSRPKSTYPKLPEMPTYKKRQPIYPRRPTPLPKSSSSGGGNAAGVSAGGSSKEAGSGEGLVITMARSKVKEYKPQFLANHKQFLTFDKVAEEDPVADVKEAKDASGEAVTLPSLTIISSTPVANSNGTDPDSPLQEFDPMQLVHNWFKSS